MGSCKAAVLSVVCTCYLTCKITADQITAEMAWVKIATEEFSLPEVPSSTTALVAEQKKYLLDHSICLLSLRILAVHVETFVRVAYNGWRVDYNYMKTPPL